MLHNQLSEMLWMIVTRFFCKTETLRDFPCILKAGIFSLKRFSLLSLKSVFDFLITLGRSETRQDKFESILEITRCCTLRRAKNTPTRSFVSRTVNRK